MPDRQNIDHGYFWHGMLACLPPTKTANLQLNPKVQVQKELRLSIDFASASFGQRLPRP